MSQGMNYNCNSFLHILYKVSHDLPIACVLLRPAIAFKERSPSEHSFFYIYHWEFTSGFFQGRPNIDECFRIRTSVQVRNYTKSGSLSKVHGRESLIFQIYVTFSSIFQIYITIISSPMLLIHFSCYFGKQRRFLPLGAHAFLTSSVHVPLNTVFNQMW